MFSAIGRSDELFIQALRTGAWRSYLVIWVAITVGIALASFLLFFIPIVSWDAVAPFYASIFQGKPLVGITSADVATAFRLSELEGFINGLMTFVAAPLLTGIQYLLGDFEKRAPGADAVM